MEVSLINQFPGDAHKTVMLTKHKYRETYCTVHRMRGYTCMQALTCQDNAATPATAPYTYILGSSRSGQRTDQPARSRPTATGGPPLRRRRRGRVRPAGSSVARGHHDHDRAWPVVASYSRPAPPPVYRRSQPAAACPSIDHHGRDGDAAAIWSGFFCDPVGYPSPPRRSTGSPRRRC
jgi:hypothetical protein